MLATWKTEVKSFGNGQILLERGQFATTIRGLMQRWGTNSTTVQQTLELFEKNGMISMKRDKKVNRTIITVTNYNKYQKPLEIVESLVENGLGKPVIGTTAEQHEDNASLLSGQGQNQVLLKEDNNIINKKNSSSTTREENLKFVEEIKNDDLSIENAMRSFKCDREQVLKWLDQFVDEVNFKSSEHDSVGKFREHFFNWVRNKLEIAKKNGKGKSDGQNAKDQYAARRGTDVGNHTAKDYGGSF